MTATPPAGWYPDHHTPGLRRYWDGTAWTEHTAPVPAPPAYPAHPTQLPAQPVVPAISRVAKVLIGVGAAALVLLSVAAFVLGVRTAGGFSADRAGALSGLDAAEACETTVAEAVRISEEQAPPVQLEDVRDLSVVEDRRETYTEPTGDGEATVLTCRGTGAWSDGDTTTEVEVGVTVDAEGTYFVFYEAVGPAGPLG
ncbi:DUF2510 domain-containing protein [Nocardioides sp. SOB77]|uniref:DUF2510 domain-containing protein n=1 Tax=Nocardioides oceani TaxID=3058369 RepID=A0ABT8FAX8_9ACTN|nr:DUF2510 domain-containing protein [Nocardioides oceani]MDN4171600.1 DUF2510 domain-containing protein [Nocardioides oceani]